MSTLNMQQTPTLPITKCAALGRKMTGRRALVLESINMCANPSPIINIFHCPEHHSTSGLLIRIRFPIAHCGSIYFSLIKFFQEEILLLKMFM